MIHHLKTWPEFFREVSARRKNFELRINDRDFRVGDTLFLKEWDPKIDKWTGIGCHRNVTYIFKGGEFGIEEGYCIMSLI